MPTITNAILKNLVYASGTSNKEYIQTPEEVQNGILFKGPVVSNKLNGVFNFSFVTMRFLQVTAGLYDQTQNYDKNNIAYILTNESGTNRIRSYICKQNDTTGKAPLSGNNKSTSNNIEVTTIDSTNTENPTYWDRLLPDNKITKTASVSSSNMYLLCPSNASGAEGSLRIKVYDSSNTLHCSFSLNFLGYGYSEFSINKCIYSKSLRSSRVSSSWGGIYYGGFGLMVTSGGCYFGVNSTSKCSKIVVEYSDCNFIPPLTSTTLPSPSSSSNKIYAIREGGGTFIQDLGIIKDGYRNSGSSSDGESLEFYLFSNGFVRWTGSQSLDSNYFHQWGKGNFGSLSIDISTYRTTKASSSPASTYGQQLPNITGSARQRKDAGLIHDAGNPLVDGCFKKGSYSIRYGASLIGLDYNAYSLAFDASLSSSIYTNGGRVQEYGFSVVKTIQAF